MTVRQLTVPAPAAITLIQRLARSRLPDLTRYRDGVWRASCPACGGWAGEGDPCFEVHADFFACRTCGIRGSAIELLRYNDGLTADEAAAIIKQEEARHAR